MGKWIYRFGGGNTEARGDMRNLLGGKGANLGEMASLGLPVPPGFNITTEVCTAFYENGQQYPQDLSQQVNTALAEIEAAMGKGFGDAANPLLVSVRSGARVSMPGMMDTVLNLGLNDQTVVGLAASSGDARFAWDSYRRFIQMFGDVVLGVAHHDFEDILETAKNTNGWGSDTDIPAEAWQEIVLDYKDLVQRQTGATFPQDVQAQLWAAIGAVFKSWQTPRAVTYRRIHNIPENWGTAVNVQAMVFGNMGHDCATGVAFTRDPSTGENYFYGEYLINAQGEDVVAGIRTPQPLSLKARQKENSTQPAMEELMPDVYAQLEAVRHTLEKHFRDMQDIEFTVERGKLYMLQTRNGKRTAAASFKIAVDMVAEGLISKEDALLRIEPASLEQLLHPMLDPKAAREVLGKGLPASPGAASGRLAFTADKAEAMAKGGEAVILARVETSPEDIHGMYAAKGILTTRGGMTSHAAVVARGMGRPCVAGAGVIQIDVKNGTLTANGITLKEGEFVTIDGGKGELMKGQVPTIQPLMAGDFLTIMGWADEIRRMQVRANAETELDAKTALDFGAEGIGLCRTEHMFFDPARIQAVREMIFAKDTPSRELALAKLLPAQRGDFEKLFTVMQGRPVTIRLLDPPLHEFLPHSANEIAEFTASAGLSEAAVLRRLEELRESNPMLGHRGCRLGISYPEIYAMQARAIAEAACSAAVQGNKVQPEIMVPLIGSRAELARLKLVVEREFAAVTQEKSVTLEYMVGTMIELPRAALMADDIAHDAAFFSFGTNDLTQTALGISRDDAASFLPTYIEQGIYASDPFVTIDIEGVGQLVHIACEKARATKAGIKLGICGEHGGDPDSIAFCEAVGLDYISCSPYRVPVARLAAAQAVLKNAALAKKEVKAA